MPGFKLFGINDLKETGGVGHAPRGTFTGLCGMGTGGDKIVSDRYAGGVADSPGYLGSLIESATSLFPEVHRNRDKEVDTVEKSGWKEFKSEFTAKMTVDVGTVVIFRSLNQTRKLVVTDVREHRRNTGDLGGGKSHREFGIRMEMKVAARHTKIATDANDIFAFNERVATNLTGFWKEHQR